MTGARRGMTLLEALIALIILGTVAVGMLEVLAGASRVATNAEQWSAAVAYAEAGMETLKLDPAAGSSGQVENLGSGFTRRVDVRPWSDPAFAVVTIDVTLPGGGHHSLTRLRAAR